MDGQKVSERAAARVDFESWSVEDALRSVGSSPNGLSEAVASSRSITKSNSKRKRESNPWLLFLKQFQSPILILLIVAAIVSGSLGEITDGLTILSIILVSGVLSFYQEFRAGSAVQELLKLIETKAQVLRDGGTVEISVDLVVPGDVVLLKAGTSIPADGKVLESDSMLVDEASLSGESAPVEKVVGLGKLGAVYAGTHVQSGSGSMLALKTGDDTMFGSVAQHLRVARPEPQFHAGIRKYGLMLMEFTLLLALVVFGINVWLHKPVVDSFLFSVALAVGLTPQLLPAIMSVTLATGARKMAVDKVIVKRLEAIEDFGSMNVLCSDKTGTLTVGTVTVAGAFQIDGSASNEVRRLARINAIGARGYDNAIDAALVQESPPELVSGIRVVGSAPYDFFRKRQSIVVEDEGAYLVIAKGSVDAVLDVCSEAGLTDTAPILTSRSEIQEQFEKLSEEGLRVLAIATRRLPSRPEVSAALEANLVFNGFIAFEDPLRDDSAEVVKALAEKGVQLKLVTGDNRHVAKHVAGKVGLSTEDILTGDDVTQLSAQALAARSLSVNVFAEVDPVQKERIILACRKAGFVVGYIGDGINDGPALHAADVGISVASAVDVAREAADFVMLERGLSVIASGVEQGRRIFANTLKYVFITTSANFGNMFSMAVTSLFLPFLPLLPKQVLLNNFLTDLPALGIASDAVDVELVQQPRRWDVASVRRFMFIFGLHSSVFDMLSFGALYWLLKASPEQFRTGWFIESAVSELAILLIVRTRRRFYKSHPGRALFWGSVAAAGLAFALPILPLAPEFGFKPLPLAYLTVLGGILLAYALTAELLKAVMGKRFPL